MKLALRDDGYERITESIEAIDNAANDALFNIDSAAKSLREIRGELYKLKQTLREVCLLTPEREEADCRRCPCPLLRRKIFLPRRKPWKVT